MVRRGGEEEGAFELAGAAEGYVLDLIQLENCKAGKHAVEEILDVALAPAAGCLRLKRR